MQTDGAGGRGAKHGANKTLQIQQEQTPQVCFIFKLSSSGLPLPRNSPQLHFTTQAANKYHCCIKHFKQTEKSSTQHFQYSKKTPQVCSSFDLAVGYHFPKNSQSSYTSKHRLQTTTLLHQTLQANKRNHQPNTSNTANRRHKIDSFYLAVGYHFPRNLTQLYFKHHYS